MEEPPSKCAVMYYKTIGRFVSFKALLTVVTTLWLWQSFLWGGMYMGCGLAVAVSIAAMAGLIIREYLAEGSIVTRLVCSFAWTTRGWRHCAVCCYCSCCGSSQSRRIC